MTFPVSLQDESPQATLAFRTRTSVQELPRLFGAALGQVGAYLAGLGENPAGPPFAAYHNADMNDLDVEIGFPVSKALPGQGEIQPGVIPGGPAARCMYTGPYDGVAAAYRQLQTWIGEKGCTATGVSYEMYLNDPATTPPMALQTLILMPLKA
jgi:effector-binding domain-containing protein